MPYFLALDAGGTKTECLLSDGYQTLARARTGSVKIFRVGEDAANGRLRDLLNEVSTLAQIPLASMSAACMGLAGISIPLVRQWAAQALGALLPTSTVVLAGDDQIALDAAFRGGPGALAIAGTGSNIVARDAHGRTANAGGYGPTVGDEGSGHWIGVNAIRFALNAVDRGSSTTLLSAIQQHWRLDSLDGLITLVNQLPHPDFSTLVPVVAQAAEAGDPVALTLLSQAGHDLALQVTAAWRRLRQPSDLPVEVAYTGSVLVHLAPVRDSLRRSLAELLPQSRLQESGVDPLDGALWLATQALAAPPQRAAV